MVRESNSLEGLGYVPPEFRRDAKAFLNRMLESELLAAYVQSAINDARAEGFDLDKVFRKKRLRAYRWLLENGVKYLAYPQMLIEPKRVAFVKFELISASEIKERGLLDQEIYENPATWVMLDLLRGKKNYEIERIVTKLRNKRIPPSDV